MRGFIQRGLISVFARNFLYKRLNILVYTRTNCQAFFGNFFICRYIVISRRFFPTFCMYYRLLRLFRHFLRFFSFLRFLPFFLRFAVIERFYCKSANRKSRFLGTVLWREPFCRPCFFRRPKAYPQGLFRKVCLCLFQAKCRPLFLPYCIKTRCP